VKVHEFSTLFDLLPIGAYRSSPDGELVCANAALLRINGFANEAEMKADVHSIGPDSYVNPQRREEFTFLLKTQGQISDFVSEMIRLKTGEPMWVREHAHMVRDENGDALYYEGTLEDITKEYLSKSALRQSETLLKSVLQTIPDRVWLKDMNGVYLTCNDAFAANLGVTAGEVVGTTERDWVDETFAAQVRATDQRVLQSGKSVMTEEVMPSPFHPSADLFEIVKTPMRDRHGNTVGILGMARDIQLRKDAEALLRDTTEQLELALMGADLGRWDHDLTREKGYRMDERACLMLGCDTRMCELRQVWGHLIHPDDLPATFRAMHAHIHHGAPTYEVEYRARHTDGHWVWLSSRGKVVQSDQNGTPLRLVGTLMDISERKLAEIKLRATQAELQATLNALPDLVIEVTVDGRYRAIHSQDVSDLIQPAEWIIGKFMSDVLPREAAAICLGALHEARDTGRSSGRQYSLSLPRGIQWFELSVVPKPTEPGEEVRLIAIARNITERKIAEQAVQHMAFHDSLTGLPNRRMLTDRLQNAVSTSARRQQHGAMLFLDLDQFKQLNDTHGHDMGDLLLQEVALRLELNVRAIDTVARLGGDEFVVLLQDLSADSADARMHTAALGEKILVSLNAPYTLKGHRHTLTTSIGATLFKGETLAPCDIFKQADTAMYEAKARGRNTLCFYEEIGPKPPYILRKELSIQ
jgi:diguanylate cyclase (GGDEF)-like protein/PAS domain S-box-containing protein